MAIRSLALSAELEFLRKTVKLSDHVIARAAGAATSTARSWRLANRHPSRDAMERVIELQAISERLVRVMQPDYVTIWLLKPNPSLGDQKPIDMIREGHYRLVSRAVSALESPPAS